MIFIRALALPNFIPCAIGLASLLAATFCPASWAGQSLAISPTNILFEGRSRTAEVLVLNRGSQAMTVRLSHRYLRPLPAGGYEEVKVLQPDDQPADDLIRYSPRQFTIPAGGAQTVRMMARKPGDLVAGEYRSHLFVRQIPQSVGGLDPDTDDEHLSVKLRAIMGISIPVIVRHGDLETQVQLTELSLQPDHGSSEAKGPRLRFKILSQGNATPRGDVIAEYLPANKRKPMQVGFIKAASVLYPLTSRELDMTLTWPDAAPMDSGTLRLRYRDVHGQRQELARSELKLP